MYKVLTSVPLAECLNSEIAWDCSENRDLTSHRFLLVIIYDALQNSLLYVKIYVLNVQNSI